MGISLTAGMRANLINLQSTANLMKQTSVRLNTGKKINSALDDPVSYFTARGHMSRASELETLKNGMSEGIQTIAAANDGINAIITLIEDAKAKAQSAKSAEVGSDTDTVNITLDGVEEGDELDIGGLTYVATAANVTADAQEFNIGHAGDYQDQATAANLATLISDEEPGVKDIDATASGVVISLFSAAETPVDLDKDDVDVDGAYNDAFIESSVIAATSDEIAALAAQYETLMDQIEELQEDAGYKGINLMTLGNTLTVNFEGDNKLDVVGFDGSLLGLNLNETASDTEGTAWGDAGNIDIDIDIAKMDAAISVLESKASTLASSTSIVRTRQDFTVNMINTLTTGADNLTLADMNEEGANMLMLQTQQALGTNSLALAAETAQSVLRLF